MLKNETFFICELEDLFGLFAIHVRPFLRIITETIGKSCEEAHLFYVIHEGLTKIQ